MARSMTGSEGAAKWVRATLANKESARKGVEQVKESPTKAAARNIDGYLSGVQDAVSSGRFERALNAVSLEDWKQAYLDKGLKNLDNGVKAAESKMARFLDKYLPYIQSKSEEIKRMPKATLADKMARIEKNLMNLEEFKKMNTRG